MAEAESAYHGGSGLQTNSSTKVKAVGAVARWKAAAILSKEDGKHELLLFAVFLRATAAARKPALVPMPMSGAIWSLLDVWQQPISKERLPCSGSKGRQSTF